MTYAVTQNSLDTRLQAGGLIKQMTQLETTFEHFWYTILKHFNATSCLCLRKVEIHLLSDVYVFHHLFTSNAGQT